LRFENGFILIGWDLWNYSLPIRAVLTLTLQKYWVQKRFAHSILGHQETVADFQDLTVSSIRFRPLKWSIPPLAGLTQSKAF
jgi:hypothetical protein